MNQNFIFTGKFRLIPGLMIAAGLLAVIVTGIVQHNSGSGIWPGLLVNTVYFNALALCGVLFTALHIVSDSGWHVSIQRIPEAMSMYLPVGAAFMAVILAGLILNWHQLYHWARPEHPDAILQSKEAFLNIPFFVVRNIVYFTGWIAFARGLRKISLKLDRAGDVSLLKRSKAIAAWFIVFFAITSSAAAWDWLMSIDVHWYSTLFGWYVFSGLFVSGTAMIIIITLLLKGAGYMQHVSAEHLHDLGKYLFGFSIFWAYLWISQYLLIWYGNLPEETIYYAERLEDFRVLFFVNLGINFAVPFLALMSRNAKRIQWILGTVAIIVFAGHWLDFYLLVVPGMAEEGHAGIGMGDIGMTVAFAGVFLMAVFLSLSKAALVPEKHPYYEESLDYHTQY